MSIIVSGAEFRTIDDDIFVNGSKVQRVDVNNSTVYPDAERVPGAYVLKAIGRTSYTAPAVKMSGIDIGSTVADIYQHEINCSASFSMAAVVSNAGGLSISDGGAVPTVTYDDLSYGPGFRRNAFGLIYSGGWVIPWGAYQTFPRFMIGSKMAPFSKRIQIVRKSVLSFELKIKLSVSFAWPTVTRSRLNHSSAGRVPIHHFGMSYPIVTDFSVKPIDVLRPRILTFLNNTHTVRTDTGQLPTRGGADGVIMNTLNYEDILDKSDFRYSSMPHELYLISDLNGALYEHNIYIFDSNIVNIYMYNPMEFFEQSYIERDSMKRASEIVPDWMTLPLVMAAIPIMNITYVGPSEEAPGWAFKALDTDL